MLCTNNIAVLIVVVVCVVAVATSTLDSLMRFLFEYKELFVSLRLITVTVCKLQTCLRGKMDSTSLSYAVFFFKFFFPICLVSRANKAKVE